MLFRSLARGGRADGVVVAGHERFRVDGNLRGVFVVVSVRVAAGVERKAVPTAEVVRPELIRDGFIRGRSGLPLRRGEPLEKLGNLALVAERARARTG